MIRNLSVQILEKVIRVLLAYYMLSLVASTFSLVEFGRLNFILAIFFFVQGLVSMGSESLVINELNARHKEGVVISSIFFLRFMVSLIVGIVILIYSFLSKELTLGIALYLILVSILSIGDSLEAFAQFRLDYKVIFWIRIAEVVVAFIFKLFLLKKGVNPVIFVSYLIVQYGVLTIGYLFYALRTRLNFTYDRSYIVTLFKKNIPLFLGGLSVMIYMRVDQLMLGHFLGLESLAKYSAAVRITEIYYFLPTVITTVFLSKYASLKDSEKTREYYSIGFGLFVLAALLISLFYYLFSYHIILIVYDEKYLSITNWLSVLSINGVFVFIGLLEHKYLIQFNKEKHFFYKNLVGALINFILNLVFIPIFGTMGAVYSTLVSLAIQNVAYDYFFDDLEELRQIKRMKYLRV